MLWKNYLNAASGDDDCFGIAAEELQPDNDHGLGTTTTAAAAAGGSKVGLNYVFGFDSHSPKEMTYNEIIPEGSSSVCFRY